MERSTQRSVSSQIASGSWVAAKIAWRMYLGFAAIATAATLPGDLQQAYVDFLLMMVPFLNSLAPWIVIVILTLMFGASFIPARVWKSCISCMIARDSATPHLLLPTAASEIGNPAIESTVLSEHKEPDAVIDCPRATALENHLKILPGRTVPGAAGGVAMPDGWEVPRPKDSWIAGATTLIREMYSSSTSRSFAKQMKDAGDAWRSSAKTYFDARIAAERSKAKSTDSVASD